jgi:hypothetical protein
MKSNEIQMTEKAQSFYAYLGIGTSHDPSNEVLR